MTDTVVQPELEIEMPQFVPAEAEVVPPDFQAEFACPEEGCDKVYPSRLGLQGHSITHKPPVSCPECGKEYRSPGALGNHRKQMHQMSQAARDAKPGIAAWHADDIFEAAVQTLWPSGQVPVRCILPLVEWREATREFLEKVR